MKVSKEKIKILRDIAAKLPKMYTAEGQLTISPVTGARMVDSGIYKLSDGQEVSVAKTYIQKAEGGVEVNHFKRLMKLAKLDDMKKIQDYINEVISINSSHRNAMSGYMERLSQTRI